MPGRANIPKSAPSVSETALSELLGVGGALERISNNQFGLKVTSRKVDDFGVATFTLLDRNNNRLTLQAQANDNVNNSGTVWRVGNFETNSYVPIINPKLTGNLNLDTNQVSFEFQNSTERFAEKINKSFESFYKKKKDDDASVADVFRRELSRSIFSEEGDQSEAMLNAGQSLSYELQRNLMATTLIGHSITGANVVSQSQGSHVTPIQASQIDRSIWEAAGINTPLNTADPMYFSKPIVYNSMIGQRPLSGLDINAINTRTGSLDMSPRIGPYSKMDYVFKRNPDGAVATNALGPIIEGIDVTSAFGKGGSGYIKSKTVPNAGIIPSEMTPISKDVWDSERGGFVKRDVMQSIIPQERYDNFDAPEVMRLNLRTSGEGNEVDTSRFGEVKNILIAPWNVPGAAGMFGSTNGKSAKQYAQIKDKRTDLPLFSYEQLESGQVQFNVNPSQVIGDVRERPKSRKSLGSVDIQTIQEKYSVPVKFDLPQAKTNISGAYYEFPRFISNDKKSWSASHVDGQDDFRELTEGEMNAIRGSVPKGFDVLFSQTAERPSMHVEYSYQSAVNPSGTGFKGGRDVMPAVQMYLHQMGSNGGQVDIPLEYVSGEVKQPSVFFMEAGFGARTTAQQKGILSDYLADKKNISQDDASDIVDNWFGDMMFQFAQQAGNQSAIPGDRTQSQYGYKMSWQDIAGFVNQQLGTNLEEMEVGQSVFQTVFGGGYDSQGNPLPVDVGGEKNISNLRNYEIGYTNQPIPLVGIHRDRLALMRESYRRATQNMGWLDDQIEAGFNHTFQMIPIPGTFDASGHPMLYNGQMNMVDQSGNPMPFLSMNAFFVNKAENIGGGGVNPSSGANLYEFDPEMARSIGYDPAGDNAQSDSNRALKQLQRWLAVEQSIEGEKSVDLNKNTGFSVTPDAQGFSDLQALVAGYNPRERGGYDALLERVSEIAGGRNNFLNFPMMNASLPPVNVAQNTLSYEEEGIQTSRGGAAYFSALKSLVEGTANAPIGTVDSDAGMAALSGLRDFATEIFEAKGDSLKNMFRTEIPLSASMRFASMSILGNNQAWMNKATRRQVMLDSGWSEKRIRQFEKMQKDAYRLWKKTGDASDLGTPMAAFRHPPQEGRTAISALNLVPDEYVAEMMRASASALGQTANIQSVLTGAENNDVFFVPESFGAKNFGDFDYDPGWFAWLVSNRNTPEGKSELYKLVDKQWQEARTIWPEDVQKIEEMVGGVNESDPRKLTPMIEKISGELNSMSDIVNAKDPMKAMDNLGVGKQRLSSFVRDTLAVHENATKGMGTTYNLRRMMEFALESSGYGVENVAESKAMMHSQYQPYLDKMYNIGNQVEGTKLATMISRSTIKIDDYDRPYLSLTTSMEGEGGEDQYKRVYFDDKGSGMLDAYSFMAEVTASGIVKYDGSKKTKYGLMQKKLYGRLMAPNASLEDRWQSALDDPRYGSTVASRAIGVATEWINEEPMENDRIARRKQLAESPIFKMSMMSPAQKRAYGKNNELMPGNFGESENQSRFFTNLVNMGFGEDLANTVATGAAVFSMKAGRGNAPAHILSNAVKTMNRIIDRHYADEDSKKNLPAGIQYAIQQMNAIGADAVNPDGYSIWNNPEESETDKARKFFRGLNSVSIDVDTETTGIVKDNPQSPVKSYGRIWQVGVNAQSQLINPDMSKDEWEKFYNIAKQSDPGNTWSAGMPSPADFDSSFGPAPSFKGYWNSTLRDQLLNNEWTSYTNFDPSAIQEELVRVMNSSPENEKPHWAEEVRLFRSSRYKNLYVSPSGDTKYLAQIFKPEIDKFNADPAHKDTQVGAKLSGIAEALAWEGNKNSVTDVFGNEQTRQNFVDLVGQNNAHDAGFDSGIMGAMKIGAINRVEAYDDQVAAAQSTAQNVFYPGAVFPRNNKGNPAQTQNPQTPAAPTPAPATNGQNSSASAMRHVRASWLDHDPSTPEGKKFLVAARAAELLGKEIPTTEALRGTVVHDVGGFLLEDQDPTGHWNTSGEKVSKVYGDVEVTGHPDAFSKVRRMLYDFKSQANVDHSFQVGFYADALQEKFGIDFKPAIAQYNSALRNAGDFIGSAQAAVNQILQKAGIKIKKPGEPATAQRAKTIADSMYGGEVDQAAQAYVADINSGKIPTPPGLGQDKPNPNDQSFWNMGDLLQSVDPYANGSAGNAYAAPSQPVNQPQQQSTQSGGQPSGSSYAGSPRFKAKSIENASRQLLSLHTNLQKAQPFLNMAMSLSPNAPGSPSSKTFDGIMQAIYQFGVYDQKDRNSMSAFIEAVGQFRALDYNDPAVSAAFGMLPDDTASSISDNPLNYVVGDRMTNNAMNSALHQMKVRMGSSTLDALQKASAMQYYGEFMDSGNQTTRGLRDAFSSFSSANPDADTDVFFQDILKNAATSPSLMGLVELNRNSRQMNIASESMPEVDPLILGFNKFTSNANNRSKLVNLNGLATPGWTQNMRGQFDALANAKKLLEPQSAGYDLLMKQEAVLRAQAKVDYLNNVNGVNRNAVGDFVPGSDEKLAQAEMALQVARKSQSEEQQRYDFLDYPSVRAFAENMGSADAPFMKAMNAFNHSTGANFNDKMTEAIEAAGGGDDARAALAQGLKDFGKMKPSARKELGLNDSVSEFIDALGTASGRGLLKVTDPGRLIDKERAVSYAKRIAGSQGFQDLETAISQFTGDPHDFMQGLLGRDDAQSRGMVKAIGVIAQDQSLLKSAVSNGFENKTLNKVLAGLTPDISDSFREATHEKAKTQVLDPQVVNDYVAKMDSLSKGIKLVADAASQAENAEGKRAKVIQLQNDAISVNNELANKQLALAKLKQGLSDSLTSGEIKPGSVEEAAAKFAITDAETAINKITPAAKRMESFIPKKANDQEAFKASSNEIDERESRFNKSGFGSFARHALSGFGLMYLRTTAAFSLEPLKDGYTEEQKSRQEIGGSIFNILGGTREVSPEDQVTRANALYMGGAGWSAVQQAKAALTRYDPGLITSTENAISGTSLFGATLWAAEQSPENRYLFTGMSKEAFNDLSESQKGDAFAKGSMRAATGMALAGMTASNVLNAYGAWANPNVTSRALAASMANGGAPNGLDFGAMGTQALSFGIAGGAFGSTFGPEGIPIGVLAGGLAGAVTSQKNAFSYLFNADVKTQTDMGVAALNSLSNGATLSSALTGAGYSSSNINQGLSQIVYSMSANPIYSDISQQSLAYVSALTEKYGYGFGQDQIAALSRQMDRGVDLIGLSRNLPTLAGAGGLDFMAKTGEMRAGKPIYNPVKPSDLSDQLESFFGDFRLTTNQFGISKGELSGTKFASDEDLKKYLGAIPITSTVDIGGAGDHLKTISYSAGQNGTYDVWGTTGSGDVTNLGTTRDTSATTQAINEQYGTGKFTNPEAVTVGEDLVKAIQDAAKQIAIATGQNENFVTENAQTGLQGLASLGVLNKSNINDVAKNPASWGMQATKWVNMQGTLEAQIYQSDVQLWQARMSAGTAGYSDMPSMDQYTPGTASPFDAARHIGMNAGQAEKTQRQSTLMQSAFKLNSMYGFGDPDTFAKTVQGMDLSQINQTENLLSLQGTTFGNVIGNPNKYGYVNTSLVSEQLSTAGIANNTISSAWMYSGGYTNMVGPNGEMQRVATNLGWGQGGNDFGWGGFSQAQIMGMGWFGASPSSNPILSQALGGMNLGKDAITLPNGSQLNQLQGFEAISWAQRQNDFNNQMFNIGQQERSADISMKYAQKGWGLDTRQMQLGWAQQEFGFNMQQQQINLSTSQFNENMAMQQKQMNISRQWAQQDWGMNAMIRDLQWGWHEQDYAENARFLTGRQRKLADRQEARDTIMHGIEGNQIDIQINRQKEQWKLEDERFAIQKKQFEESKKLQQEQIDQNRKFFEQSKQLQIESHDLQVSQFIEQHQLQLESIAHEKEQAAIMLDLGNKMQLANIAASQAGSQLQNVGAVAQAQLIGLMQGIANMFASLINFANSYANQLNSMNKYGTTHAIGGTFMIPSSYGYEGFRLGNGDTASAGEIITITPANQRNDRLIPISGNTANTSSGNNSGSTRPINIYLGNELLKSYVLDVVTGELRNG